MIFHTDLKSIDLYLWFSVVMDEYMNFLACLFMLYFYLRNHRISWWKIENTKTILEETKSIYSDDIKVFDTDCYKRWNQI